MPDGDPWPSIKKVLDAEMLVRSKKTIDADAVGVEPYWADLIVCFRYLPPRTVCASTASKLR